MKLPEKAQNCGQRLILSDIMLFVGQRSTGLFPFQAQVDDGSILAE
jgi:hypothetical protein